MENYEIVQAIGKGSFGVVSQVKKISDGKIYVWKELNYGKMTEREKQQLVAEVNILRDLKHPNIVRYHDRYFYEKQRIIDKKTTKIYIIMEYCQGGDLGQLLKKCRKEKDYISEDVIWKILTQIILALNECHTRKNKILHRDLKPANIFLDDQNNIKLGDFGLARLMSEDSVFAQTHVGTPYYMSPEQINESKYNEKSDIWSAGCLLYEISSLKPPFEATNHLSLAIKIKSGKVDRIPQRYSEDLWRMIQAMLCVDPEKRADIQQLLAYPHINIRIQEKSLKDQHSFLKTEEEHLKQREDSIKKQEHQIDQLQSNIEKQEQELIQLRNKIQQIDQQKQQIQPKQQIQKFFQQNQSTKNSTLNFQKQNYQKNQNYRTLDYQNNSLIRKNSQDYQRNNFQN